MSDLPPTATARPRPAMSFRELVILCGCLMALNSLAIDLMMPALPSMGRDLGVAHANDRQLIISSYVFGLGCGSLVFGVLADRFGRKVVLGVGLALFVVFNAVCASASSFAIMLIGRTLAGVLAGSSRVITVGIVRDRFTGNAMARTMSLVMTIYMMVQVVAPSLGQAMLWIGPWRWIFWALAAFAASLTGWLLLRLPETLLIENRQRISPASLLLTIRSFVTTRSSFGYMLASGVVTATLIAFLTSVQQIFSDAFHAVSSFPLAYACIAGVMMFGSLTNSKLVVRFGARSVSQLAVAAMALVAAIHAAVIVSGHETMIVFVVFQSGAMVCLSFVAANFGAIAMEPFRKGAGTASAFQTFVITAISTVLGSFAGRAFDGTPLPLVASFVVFGGLGLAIVAWTERGRFSWRSQG